MIAALLAMVVTASAASAAFPGPNGKVAYLKCPVGPDTLEHCDVWTVNPDGTGAADLTAGSSGEEASPAWSPDGNYIAFTSDGRFSQSGARDVYVMRSDGTEANKLTNVSCASGPAWSPDGQKIAFSEACGAGESRVEVVNVDGTGLTTITTNATGPAWSPDGQKIAFDRNGAIWTMNPDGSAQTQLTNPPGSAEDGGPNWSPDGAKLVFSSDRHCSTSCAQIDLYTVNADGSNVTRLRNGLTTALAPAWSTDGTKVVFQTCFDFCSPGTCTADSCDVDIHVINADGTGESVLAGAPEAEREPDWGLVAPPLPRTDELGRLVFRHDYSSDPGIYTINPDGTHMRGPLTSDGTQPAWSPDGKKIAFTGPGGVDYDVYVMNADGTGKTNLTAGAHGADPTWSPDGTEIAFTRASRIWVMNAGGTNQTQVSNGPGGEFGPDWSPDGTNIAFVHLGAIYTIKADGTGLTPITTPPSGDQDVVPKWSPDGSKIVFGRYEPNPSGGSVANIWTVNRDGTGETQVTNRPGETFDSANWSADGGKILFTREDDDPLHNDELYAINPDGSGEKKITSVLGTDWQPDALPINSYPRPKGATPLRASLTIAYEPCTAPNRDHGAPLVTGSCNPPQMSSQYLTVGTLDSNDMPARSEGAVRYDAVLDKPATPADESDVKLSLTMSDVFTTALADYAGELDAEVTVQITDKDNTPSPGGSGAATTMEFPFPVYGTCTPTADTTIGSDCAAATTANALVAGSVKGGKRAIWQLGRIRVYDGGADDYAATTSDNTLFADEGIFVP